MFSLEGGVDFHLREAYIKKRRVLVRFAPPPPPPPPDEANRSFDNDARARRCPFSFAKQSCTKGSDTLSTMGGVPVPQL